MVILVLGNRLCHDQVNIELHLLEGAPQVSKTKIYTYIQTFYMHLLLKGCFSAANSNQEPPDLAHLPVQLVHGPLPLQREASQEGQPPQENPLQGPEDPVALFNHPVQ